MEARASRASGPLAPALRRLPARGLGGPGAALLAAAAAVALGASGLPSVRLLAMNDLGLVSVLPIRLLVALGILTVGFVWVVRRSPRGPLVLGYMILLIAALYGLPAMLGGEATEHVAWRHAGIVDYVARHGSVDGTLDAYFNWPAFFILSAFVQDVAGVRDVLSVANWGPLFFNLLYLAPLLVIFRTVTEDRRTVWLAVAVFYLANWVSQDYFAPQALAYFLFLALIAVVLRWFRTEPDSSRPRFRGAEPSPLLRPGRGAGVSAAPEGRPPGGAARGGRERAALLLVAVLIFAAMVPIHQLTPFAALLSVGLLVLARRCSARGMPALMAVMIVAWLVFMAVAYLNGNLERLLAGIGDLGAAASENVSGRVTGSPGHELVVTLRLALTGGLWLLAAIGALVRLRSGHRDRALVVLALAPFPLLALQSYGGEMLLRVYLFSLPFVAFFVATLLARLLPRGAHAGGAWRSVAIGGATLVLLAGFMITRYGNQRVEVFSGQETRAVERLYEIAPPGAELVAGSVNVPWKAQGYELYEYDVVTEMPAWELARRDDGQMPTVLADVIALMEEHRRSGAFLILSRSQREYTDLLDPAPRGSLASFEQMVSISSRFRLVYENRDASVWQLGREGAPGA